MNTQMQKKFDRLEHAIGDGDPQTLRKARHYLDKLIELEENAA